MIRRARSAITKQLSECASPDQARSRSVLTKQLSSCACYCQACAQCYDEAVERAFFPWSGVRAVRITYRSSREGALTMVRRARSALTKQSIGCAYHGQACAQCQGEAVERACYAGLYIAKKCVPLSTVSGACRNMPWSYCQICSLLPLS